jgi:hypothetical protein
MGIKGIDLIRQRIAKVQAMPFIVARGAASRIEQKLREDATTKRGNVPSYGKMGNVPIVVEVSLDDAIHVRGPGWVLQKAQQLGQVEQWIDIVHDESAKALAGGNR